ncbi:hypothetical protein V6N13_126475 [Hibiscus sabdariffa]
MDVADATPLNMSMPTPPASPIRDAAAPTDGVGPSTPAEPQQTPPPSSPIVLVSNYTTTTSPATTPAARERSRERTPDTPLGTTPSSPSPPALAQSEEAVPPLHILQLRSQLQRIEAMQIHFQEEMKSPRDHLQPLSPTTTPALVVPILSAAPTPTTSAVVERPTPESSTRRKGKAKVGISFGRDIPSSPDDEEAEKRPPKRRSRYHVITAESDDDDSSAELPVAQPEKSTDPSLSTTF